jgi:hypothetical protein
LSQAAAEPEAGLDAIDRALVSTATEWGSSRWGEYARCPRAHELRYHEGVRLQKEPRYFITGRFVHAAINYLQEGVIAGEPEPRDWRAVIARIDKHNGGPSPESTEALGLLAGYFSHYGTANAGWPEGARIIGSELPLRSPEGTFALPYTGQADTVIDVAGTILVPDTKTRASRIPEDSGKRLQLARELATRPQFVGLSFNVKHALGLDHYPAIWLNAIIKTKVPQFDRLMVPISESAVEFWLTAQGEIAREMMSNRRTIPIASSCATGFGPPCWAFDWCHRPALREERFKVEPPQHRKEAA